MATIKPFRPIRPNPVYADQLVFTKPQAESVAGDDTQEGGLKPLKTLLESGARLRPETTEGQATAYRNIKETLQSLLDHEQVWQEQSDGIYVYEAIANGQRQTGIWALTDVGDYINGHIKIHELTLADSVRRMQDYRASTRLEGSPVLLAYPPDGTVNAIISITKVHRPDAVFGNEHGVHRIWKIADEALQQKLIEAFSKVGRTYLADGHHRLESAARLAGEQRAQGNYSAQYLSSLYLSTEQLRIEPYDRVILPDVPPNKVQLLQSLNLIFYLQESTGNRPVHPKEQHRMGLYLDGQWYHLLARDWNTTVGAVFLQEQVLSKLFGIADPRTDGRLKCAGGEKALEEIGAIIKEQPGAIAFTLCPLSADLLLSVAEAGQILPPKSTWIIPKVPYGLLIHQNPT